MILVTGAAGVMGSRLVRRLVADGHSVRALVLPGDPLVSRLADCDCEITEGDITDRAGLDEALRGTQTVYHLAAVIVSRDPELLRRINVDGTRNVAGAASAAGVEHLIYVSSASVTYRRFHTSYSKSKADAERIVRAMKSTNVTVVRPTLVYDRTGGQEIEMFARILGSLPVVPFIGDGAARKRPVFAPDVVDGLAAIARNPRTYGKTYNLSGGEAVSMMDLARLLARQLGRHPVIIPVPAPLCRIGLMLGGTLIGRRTIADQVLAGFVEDADLDNGDARRDLGYRPQPVSACLTKHFHRRN